jgi:MinD superfamily P-loop ATPase
MEIAVISGKGGTGKSSLSAAFATLNERVVLVDCDVDAANLYILFNPTHDEELRYTGSLKAVIDDAACTNCGLCIDYCRFDAITTIRGEVKILDSFCDGCQLCSRICPVGAISMVKSDNSRIYSGSFRNGRMVYGRLAPGEENSGKMVNILREKAKLLAKEHSLKTILLDGPPGIGCPVISTITGVHTLVVVTEPTLSGLHDLERTLEIAEKFHLKAWVVINKYDINQDVRAQIKNYCMHKNIVVAGEIPYDSLVVESMVNCKSIIEWAPDSYVSSQIRNIWEVLHS